MKYKYKKLPLKNEKDFLKAERLVKKGWYVILTGLYYILLERRLNNDRDHSL